MSNEVVETVDEQALARENSHLNPFIPEQVAKAVLENFCNVKKEPVGSKFQWNLDFR